MERREEEREDLVREMEEELVRVKGEVDWREGVHMDEAIMKSEMLLLKKENKVFSLFLYSFLLSTIY